MKKLINIPKHQPGGVPKIFTNILAKKIARLAMRYPKNEERLIALNKSFNDARLYGDRSTLKNIEQLVDDELKRAVLGASRAGKFTPLDRMSDEEFSNFILSKDKYSPIEYKEGPLSPEERQLLDHLYSKEPSKLTSKEVIQLQNLSRRNQGLPRPVDERTPDLSDLMPEGAVDTREYIVNPYGSYGDLPTILPRKRYKDSNYYYKQDGGEIIPMNDFAIEAMLRRKVVQDELKKKGKQAAIDKEKEFEKTDLQDVATMVFPMATLPVLTAAGTINTIPDLIQAATFTQWPNINSAAGTLLPHSSNHKMKKHFDNYMKKP